MIIINKHTFDEPAPIPKILCLDGIKVKSGVEFDLVFNNWSEADGVLDARLLIVDEDGGCESLEFEKVFESDQFLDWDQMFIDAKLLREYGNEPIEIALKHFVAPFTTLTISRSRTEPLAVVFDVLVRSMDGKSEYSAQVGAIFDCLDQFLEG